MKTIRCFKTIAVCVAVILLGTAVLSTAQTAAMSKKTHKSLSYAKPTLPRTTDNQKSVQTSCADFGKDVIDAIKDDRQVREAFFTELANDIKRRNPVEVLSIFIDEDDQICIRYQSKINRKNFTETQLV